MFKPKTPIIQNLAQQQPKVIEQLENLLTGRCAVYIDYANVRSWSKRLGWEIDLKRLYQFLKSFDNIQKVSFYFGMLSDDERSAKFIKTVKRFGYRVRTKPVKVMRIPIDVSSISPESPDILKQCIHRALLQKLDIQTIEYLNTKLGELNKNGIDSLEEWKCNFDVEIAMDMTVDYERNGIDCFGLWSGDSDFHDLINELLNNRKKVILFATARRIAFELNELRLNGLIIFDIAKLRNFLVRDNRQK